MSVTFKVDNKISGALLSTEGIEAQRHSMALDALSKLATQFANKPEFGHLIETMVLTLSGQFTAPNAFAAVINPGTHSNSSLYYGTGRFKNRQLLSSLEFTHHHRDYFLKNKFPQYVKNFNMSDQTSKLGFILSECDVLVVVPLLHGDRLIGILGLGNKATKKPYSDNDLDLLGTLVNSVAPFIANSFLFEEIAEINQWHLEILNSVRQGVFVFDKEHLLVKINMAGYRILKEFKASLPGMESLNHIPMEWIFPNSFYHEWISYILGVVNNPVGTNAKSLVANSVDHKRVYSVAVSSLEGEHANEGGFVITLDDVTSQKEGEQRLFELSRLAEKGDMASSIAHELNNFLGMVLGGVELAEINHSKGKTDKTTENLKKLKENVNKMTRYTAGLMDYGRLNTIRSENNLNVIISDILSFISVQKRFRHIKITSELNRTIPILQLDSDQITQILMNIMNNAADAIKEQNTSIGEIIIKTDISDDFVILSITDNGIGMCDEVKGKILRSNYTSKKDGHGYGLTTCAQIINNHNGQVEIVSEVGKGSTFRISLPINI